MDTRLFFVVDSRETHEELFETREKAINRCDSLMTFGDDPRLRICMVKNAYRDGEGWNYDDQADTFETIKELGV